jgi:superoxide reductase
LGEKKKEVFVVTTKFGALLKGAEAEGKEKHVPEIGIGADTVRVIVGKEVPHPNTVEHHIEWLELYGVKANGQVVNLGRAEFAPTYTKPEAEFKVPVADFKTLCALECCIILGVWENCVEV